MREIVRTGIGAGVVSVAAQMRIFIFQVLVAAKRFSKEKFSNVTQINANRRGRISAPALLAAIVLGSQALPALAKQRALTIFALGDYIDESVIRQFEKSNNVIVAYESFGSEDALEAALDREAVSPDLVVISSERLRRRIDAKYFRKLELGKVSNEKNVAPEIKKFMSYFDKENSYSVAYMWYTMGIAINQRLVEAIRGDSVSIRSFFDEANLKKYQKCGIGVVDSSAEIFAAANRSFWADWRTSPNSAGTVGNSKRLVDLVAGASKYLTKYPDYKLSRALAAGDLCVAIAYSVDVSLARAQLQDERDTRGIQFLTFAEGSPIVLDNLAIPSRARQPDLAYRFINYLLEPDIAALNVARLNIASSVLAAKQFVPPNIRNDAAIYPREGSFRHMFIAAKLDSATQDALDNYWKKIAIAK